MRLETRDLRAEVLQPPDGYAADAARPSRLGAPWWMQPSDYPLTLAPGQADQTLLETTSEFWVVVSRLTAIVYSVDAGFAMHVPSDRFPVAIRVQDASRRFPLVPDWAPLVAVCGVGRSQEGTLPGKGWAVPPNTTVVVELRNDGTVPVGVFVQAEAARVLYEGEGGGA